MDEPHAAIEVRGRENMPGLQVKEGVLVRPRPSKAEKEGGGLVPVA